MASGVRSAGEEVDELVVVALVEAVVSVDVLGVADADAEEMLRREDRFVLLAGEPVRSWFERAR